MLIRRALVVAMILAALVPAPARADEAPAFKAHELSPEREAAWVKAVQDTKTDDGTTVLQALRYAEMMRPAKFKVGPFQSVYSGGSGEPDGIAVDFWIGAKRETDDAFSIIFEVAEAGGKITVPRPKTQYGGTAAEAVITGRDGFLRFIDEQYHENCIDTHSGEKLC